MSLSLSRAETAYDNGFDTYCCHYEFRDQGQYVVVDGVWDTSTTEEERTSDARRLAMKDPSACDQSGLLSWRVRDLPV